MRLFPYSFVHGAAQVPMWAESLVSPNPSQAYFRKPVKEPEGRCVHSRSV